MAEWFAVISITLLAVISPGPDFAMVSRNALLMSRRSGVLTALGIGGGVLVHVSYTLLGVGILMRQSPLLFGLLKLAGAAYLVWLGVKMLRTKTDSTEVAAVGAPLPDRVALRTGFLTNALNPKTTVFIMSLFMHVVQETTPLATQIGYGLFIAAAHVAWFATVALAFAAPAMQALFRRFRGWIDRAFGTALIGFGIGLVMAKIG